MNVEYYIVGIVLLAAVIYAGRMIYLTLSGKRKDCDSCPHTGCEVHPSQTVEGDEKAEHESPVEKNINEENYTGCEYYTKRLESMEQGRPDQDD